jgi:hypothetical protein
MKIIPFLRFGWATFMTVNFVSRTNFGTGDGLETIFVFLDSLITVTFSAYCIITGIEEVKREQIIDARFFEVFGLFFEFLIFFGGFYLLSILLKQPVNILRIALLMIWQFGLIVLLIVDFKKIRAS